MSPLKSNNKLPSLIHTTQMPICLWGLLALTAVVRVVGIGRPLLGNFSTKNVVYAMIARNWAEGRASLWYPTLDCLQDGNRSLHMLEWPVSAYLTGSLWRTFGGSLDVWGRATSVAMSVASVLVLFLLVRRRHGQTAAVGAGFVLALSPVAITFGQSFMLETSLMFFTLATIYCVDRWKFAGSLPWLALGSVALALLLLTKIYMLVLLLPLGVMVLGKNDDGQRTRRDRLVAVLAIGLAILPAAVWYAHAMRTAAPDNPLAERIYYSVRHSAEAHRPPHPLLFTPDFYRQVLDDLSTVVLTPVAFMLPFVGLLDRSWRRHAAWLVAMAVLVVALPRKFYEMHYYYMAILPPLCIMAGLGWQRLAERLRPGRVAVGVLLVLALGVSLRYAAKPSWATPDEDRHVVAAARAMRELTLEDERVVTMHGTGLDLLYYCNRPGWNVASDEADLRKRLAECRGQGARYLVATGPGSQRLPALERLPVVAQGEGFDVYRLVGQ